MRVVCLIHISIIFNSCKDERCRLKQNIFRLDKATSGKTAVSHKTKSCTLSIPTHKYILSKISSFATASVHQQAHELQHVLLLLRQTYSAHSEHNHQNEPGNTAIKLNRPPCHKLDLVHCWFLVTRFTFNILPLQSWKQNRGRPTWSSVFPGLAVYFPIKSTTGRSSKKRMVKTKT